MYQPKIDYKVPRFGRDIGLPVTRSNEGTAYVDNSDIFALYCSEDFVLSFGLQAGIINRAINYRKVVFNNQIDPAPGIVGPIGCAGILHAHNKFYFDQGFGINLVVGDLKPPIVVMSFTNTKI